MLVSWKTWFGFLVKGQPGYLPGNLVLQNNLILLAVQKRQMQKMKTKGRCWCFHRKKDIRRAAPNQSDTERAGRRWHQPGHSSTSTSLTGPASRQYLIPQPTCGGNWSFTLPSNRLGTFTIPKVPLKTSLSNSPLSTTTNISHVRFCLRIKYLFHWLKHKFLYSSYSFYSPK